jgi:hypothetical protein
MNIIFMWNRRATLWILVSLGAVGAVALILRPVPSGPDNTVTTFNISLQQTSVRRGNRLTLVTNANRGIVPAEIRVLGDSGSYRLLREQDIIEGAVGSGAKLAELQRRSPTDAAAMIERYLADAVGFMPGRSLDELVSYADQLHVGNRSAFLVGETIGCPIGQGVREYSVDEVREDIVVLPETPVGEYEMIVPADFFCGGTGGGSFRFSVVE